MLFRSSLRQRLGMSFARLAVIPRTSNMMTVEDNESENNTSSGQNHVKVEKPTENTAEENIPDSTQESKEQEKVSNIKIEPPSRKEGEQDR